MLHMLLQATTQPTPPLISGTTALITALTTFVVALGGVIVAFRQVWAELRAHNVAITKNKIDVTSLKAKT
jgi:hypothetical protein